MTTPTTLTAAAAITATPFLPWIMSFLNSFEAQQLIVYLIVGIVGIFSHYIKGYLQEEITGSFFKYMTNDHPKRSLAMFLSFIGSGVIYVTSGATAGMGWAALLGLAFTTGYSIDSTVNKSTPPSIK